MTEAVTAVVHGPHADLLEYLAARIADAALASGAPHATAVTGHVSARPDLPFLIDLSSAGVTIHRRRAT